MKTAYLYIVLIGMLAITGCKEKYNLPPTLIDKNYLVVEGFINNGSDTTEIRLSRTTRPDTAYIRPEENAIVSIEQENGETFLLEEKGNGSYKGGPYILNPAATYKLHVRTANGKEYTSEQMEVKTTPAIDSVNWIRTRDGVQINVNTHDPSNNSRYYIWQYDETWEFHSYTSAYYVYRDSDTTMQPNPDPDSMFRCWQFENSTAIHLGSSARLSEDIIFQSPLILIGNGSWKLSTKYSVLVKQRVLTKGAFEYLQKMKKSSEQLGTIFDPQPSTSSGNISCDSDPTEMVIGYVYVSDVQRKRIFIDRNQVPDWNYRLFCEVDTIPDIKDSLAYFFGSLRMGAISLSLPPEKAGYLASSAMCMDCTLRGTNVKPGYWP